MKNTRMIRREWYASHGICVECGQREAEPHKRKCWECSEKKAEYNRKYNANMTPEQKEKNSIRHKKMYESRKAAGICVYCGKKPAVSGKVACVMCAKRDAKRHMEKRRENGALPRYMFGDGYHCVTCGKDIDNGKKQCDECYSKSVHALEIARGKAKGGFRSHKLVFGKAAAETK